MPDNTPITAGAGTNIATRSVTYSGDAAQAPVVGLVTFAGADDAKTVADVPAGGGVEATALRVTIASDSTGVVSVDDNGGALTVDGTVAVSTNAELGIVTETAPGTDTASSGLNGRLQRIAQRLTSLIALLPAALGAGGGLKSEGVIADGAAISGNPQLIGLTDGANLRALNGWQVTADGATFMAGREAVRVASYGLWYDDYGDNWVRARAPAYNRSLLLSAARTASTTSADFQNYAGRGLHVIVDVTAIVTAPSIVVVIEGRDLGQVLHPARVSGDHWYRYHDPARIPGPDRHREPDCQ